MAPDAVAVVVPDGQSGARAVAAVRPPEGVVARPPVAAVVGPAWRSAAPDEAVVVEAAQPGVAARSVRQPAEWASAALRRVWLETVAEAPCLAFVPFPERPDWFQGPEPIRRLSADPLEVLAHSLRAGLAAPVSRWGSAPPERVPSRLGVQAVRLSCPAPAGHWALAAPDPEAAHLEIRWQAMAQLSDPTACREAPA